MGHEAYDDEDLLRILTSTKVIAMVGASPKEARPSHRVMSFLLKRGYKVIPVNPGHEGREIHEQRVVAKLSDIKEPIDMVDIFRNSTQVGGIVDEVLALPHLPKYVWMQLGVGDDAAAARAEARGIEVIMNRCPAIEIPRLGIL
jgi:predicted CoA-binding protein